MKTMHDDTMISIENLVRSFESKEVLSGVNLEIKRGESIVIIGRSGCGKSVLLKHIIGLFKPDSGHLFVDGEDVTAMEEESLYRVRHKMGMLFQGAALFDSLDVLHNVGLAPHEHTKMNDG